MVGWLRDLVNERNAAGVHFKRLNVSFMLSMSLHSKKRKEQLCEE